MRQTTKQNLENLSTEYKSPEIPSELNLAICKCYERPKIVADFKHNHIFFTDETTILHANHVELIRSEEIQKKLHAKKLRDILAFRYQQAFINRVFRAFTNVVDYESKYIQMRYASKINDAINFLKRNCYDKLIQFAREKDERYIVSKKRRGINFDEIWGN